MIYELRKPMPDDLNFIYSSWLKHYRKNENKISTQVYYDKYKKILTSILERSFVIVACNQEKPSQVYGYIVYEPTDPVVVHYIYIKSVYRQFRIASTMIEKIRHEDDPIVCTFATYAFLKLKDKWRLSYNPWLR
jgi:hypothetical protein